MGSEHWWNFTDLFELYDLPASFHNCKRSLVYILAVSWGVSSLCSPIAPSAVCTLRRSPFLPRYWLHLLKCCCLVLRENLDSHGGIFLNSPAMPPACDNPALPLVKAPNSWEWFLLTLLPCLEPYWGDFPHHRTILSALLMAPASNILHPCTQWRPMGKKWQLGSALLCGWSSSGFQIVIPASPHAVDKFGWFLFACP